MADSKLPSPMQKKTNMGRVLASPNAFGTSQLAKEYEHAMNEGSAATGYDFYDKEASPLSNKLVSPLGSPRETPESSPEGPKPALAPKELSKLDLSPGAVSTGSGVSGSDNNTQMPGGWSPGDSPSWPKAEEEVTKELVAPIGENPKDTKASEDDKAPKSGGRKSLAEELGLDGPSPKKAKSAPASPAVSSSEKPSPASKNLDRAFKQPLKREDSDFKKDFEQPGVLDISDDSQQKPPSQ